MLRTLQASILEEAPLEVVSKHVVEKIPHIFGNDWESYRQWRRKLAGYLDVDSCEIALTGSAAVGFSLNPYKDFRAFGKNSDVDVAVVSERHFSEAWRHLRQLNPFTESLSGEQRSALRLHQTNYVYWGCIATDLILPVLPFGTKWLEGLSKMSGQKPSEGRTINARIYRDFRALYGYQALGVSALKTKLLTAK